MYKWLMGPPSSTSELKYSCPAVVSALSLLRISDTSNDIVHLPSGVFARGVRRGVGRRIRYRFPLWVQVRTPHTCDGAPRVLASCSSERSLMEWGVGAPPQADGTHHRHPAPLEPTRTEAAARVWRTRDRPSGHTRAQRRPPHQRRHRLSDTGRASARHPRRDLNTTVMVGADRFDGPIVVRLESDTLRKRARGDAYSRRVGIRSRKIMGRTW